MAAGQLNADLSKSQRAHRFIQEQIARGEFTPGYRLVLGSIARSLDMSVVPVREAIRRLEAEGLVTFERNVGAHVTMVDESAYLDTMQVLGVLEGAATALSAPRLSADDIRRARAVNELMISTLDDFDPHSFTALNREFHAVLFERCANPRLLELVRGEWRRLGRLRDSTFSFVPGRAAESVREHEAILRLVEGDAPPEEIEQFARRHRSATLEAYLAREQPEPPSASPPAAPRRGASR